MRKQIIIFIRSLVFLFPGLLIAASLIFYFVRTAFQGTIFGTDDAPIWLSLPYRGVNFSNILDVPIPYLLSISLVAALVGAFWSAFIIPRRSRFILIQILIIPWIAVVLTGPIWGFIWSNNHWPTNGFTDYETLMLFRRTDIENGFVYSWLSAIQSYPLNVFSFIAYAGLLLINKRFIVTNQIKGER